jgi:hypothetical protein
MLSTRNLCILRIHYFTTNSLVLYIFVDLVVQFDVNRVPTKITMDPHHYNITSKEK